MVVGQRNGRNGRTLSPIVMTKLPLKLRILFEGVASSHFQDVEQQVQDVFQDPDDPDQTAVLAIPVIRRISDLLGEVGGPRIACLPAVQGMQLPSTSRSRARPALPALCTGQITVLPHCIKTHSSEG